MRSPGGTFDLLSLSAHKFGGPKGVGVLVERGGPEVDPLIIGGGQERERRSAPTTPPASSPRPSRSTHRRERVEENLRLAILSRRARRRVAGPSRRSGRDRASRAQGGPGSAHVCIAGIESEALLFLLDEAGVCASAASVRASAGAMEPSHVLAAMGVERSVALGALRLTLGHTTTAADVERAVDVVGASVDQLRRRMASAPIASSS